MRFILNDVSPMDVSPARSVPSATGLDVESGVETVLWKR